MTANLDNFPDKYDISREKEIYGFWMNENLFHAETARKYQEKEGFAVEEAFSVALPPPNVTGKLHLGHSMMLAVEDAMIRHARMLGKDTLRIPGTDHAGIATQVVVEKKLLQTENKTRHEIGRENFLGHVWDRVKEHRETIVGQTKAMGSSLDRSREQFTLSEHLSRAVRKAFSMLYNKNKVYHGSYLINRCPRCHTVLSDLEAVYKEKEVKLYYLKYFVANEDGSANKEFISVATVRPETIFGDVAIAVHPDDTKYKHLIGKNVLIPIVDKIIPVIADTYVDVAFGTGALKITPCHDPHDFEIGKKHNLPLDHYSLTKCGKFSKLAGSYADLDVAEHLEKLYTELEDKNILIKKEAYQTKIPECDRCSTRVEPMISQQWFVNIEDAAIKSIQSVNNNKTTIHPQRFNKTFFSWIEKIRPWCISRQLRWGHRIPVWHCQDCKQMNAMDEDKLDFVLEQIVFNLVADSRLRNPFDVTELFALLNEDSLTPQEGKIWEVFFKMYTIKYAKNSLLLDQTNRFKEIMINKDLTTLELLLTEQRLIKQDEENNKFTLIFICESCKSKNLEQDPDVLDTWFSSGLWPFSILGWPEKTPDLEKYYPNTVLETGADILFFRVARMMFMGHEIMGEEPFSNIYLHGLIRATDGQKMSKSKGNGIDPLEIIAKYGADALRLGLLVGSTPGADIRFSEERIEYFRRFLNKLWNATRFVLMKTDISEKQNYDDLRKNIENNVDKLNDFDQWILNKINMIIQKSENEMENFMLGEFAQSAVELVWHDFCDWYIEISKQEHSKMTDTVLIYAVGTLLKLLHPFIPYVTEKLWQTIPFEGFLMVKSYPQTLKLSHDTTLVNKFMEIVSSYRNLRVETNIKQQEKCLINFHGNTELQHFIQNHETILQKLTGAEAISYEQEVGGFATSVFQDIILGVKSNKKIDLGALKIKLEANILEKQKQIKSLEAQLTNERFVNNAPAQVIKDRKASLGEAKKTLSSAEEELKKIQLKKI